MSNERVIAIPESLARDLEILMKWYACVDKDGMHGAMVTEVDRDLRAIMARNGEPAAVAQAAEQRSALRDQFAMQALGAITKEHHERVRGDLNETPNPMHIATASYVIADCMLMAREVKP